MTDYRNRVGKSSTSMQTGVLDYGMEDQQANGVNGDGSHQVTTTEQPSTTDGSEQSSEENSQIIDGVNNKHLAAGVAVGVAGISML